MGWGGDLGERGVRKLGLCVCGGEGDSGEKTGLKVLAAAWERGEGGAGRSMGPPLRSRNSAPALSTRAAAGSYLTSRGSPGPGQPRGRVALGTALAKALASPPRGKRRRRGERE
jgi:hypothetical protein